MPLLHNNNMLSQEDISQLIGNCETPTLKTPRTVSDEFVEIPGSPISLFLSFDMENATHLPPSPAMNEDAFRYSDETSSLEDVQDITSFVNMLKFNSDKVKLEAASALLHVLSINHANTVVECGAIPVLLEALQCSKQSVRDECVKCLSAIISFSSQLRDHVIQMGGLSKLLRSVDNASSDVSLNNLLKAISAFFDHEIRPTVDLITPFLPRIIEMLNSERESSIIVESCKILSRLMDNCSQIVQLLLDLGTKRRLMQLLNHQDESVVVSALRTCRHLVPPREVTLSREPPVSPIRTFTSPKRLKKMPTGIDAWKISPLMSHAEASTDKILDLDVLVCQNVEMFRTSEGGDRKSSGSLNIDKVGLRCIHCEKSPFARAEYSTVFPGGISSIAASIRYMASRHFTSCTNTPDHLRTKMIQFSTINASSHGDRMHGLENFCSDLCARVGVQNRYPPRSGLSVANGKSGNNCIAREAKPLTFEEKLRETSPPTLRQKIKIESHKHPMLMPIKKERPSVESKGSCVQKENRSATKHFVPVQRGVWRCILCLANCNETPSGIWKGNGPPPTAYTGWHDWECHRENLSASSNLKPRSITSNSLYQGVKCDPVLSNAAVLHDYSKVKCDHVLSNTVSHDYSEAKCDPVLSNDEILQRDYSEAKGDPDLSSDFVLDQNANSLCSDIGTSGNSSDSFNLVHELDKDLLTPFTAFVMEQLEACHLDRRDNKKMKYKFPLGFAGLRCTHCVGMKGARKFFWSCPDRFKNNSTELSKHLLKCTYCPDEIKERLAHLKTFHPSHMKKLPRGGQIIFFRRMFNRLHHGNKSNLAGSSPPPPMPSLSAREKEIVRHGNSAAPPLPSLSADKKESGLHGDSPTDKLISGGRREQAADLDSDSPRTCLGLNEDLDWLEADECILRQNIEIFCLTTDDIDAMKSYSKNLRDYLTLDGNNISSVSEFVTGQAGLRCLHCSKSRLCKGLSDPFAFKVLTSVEEIRDKCRALQKHLTICHNAPEECKTACKNTLSNLTFKITRKYYTNAAHKVGLYNEKKMVKLAPTGIDIGGAKDVSPSPITLAPLDVNPKASRGSIDERTLKARSNTVTPSFGGTKRNFEMM